MLIIPDAVWVQMLVEFARHENSVERVAYLDGIRTHDASGQARAVVTTLTIPRATLTSGWYRVDGVDMANAGQHFRVHGLWRLAQVHTHGDTNVGHSSFDNREAYSQRVGSISIVLPNHARLHQSLDGAGVHVRDPEGWRQLTVAEAQSFVQFVPSTIDLRDQSCLISPLNSPAATRETQAAVSDPSPKRRQRPWSWLFQPRRP